MFLRLHDYSEVNGHVPNVTYDYSVNVDVSEINVVPEENIDFF